MRQQPVGDLLDRPVASNRDNALDSAPGCVRRQLLRVSRMLRDDDLTVDSEMAEDGAYPVDVSRRAGTTRGRVRDKGRGESSACVDHLKS